MARQPVLNQAHWQNKYLGETPSVKNLKFCNKLYNLLGKICIIKKNSTEKSVAAVQSKINFRKISGPDKNGKFAPKIRRAI